MPQVRVKGIELGDLCGISDKIIETIKISANVDPKYIKIEHVERKIIEDGIPLSGYPMMDILWFPRQQETRDKLAKALTCLVKECGCDTLQVTFTEMEAYKFFEDGEHY